MMKNICFKKMISCLLSAALLCALGACGQPSAQQTAPPSQSQDEQNANQSQSSQTSQSGTGASNSEATPPTTTDKDGAILVIYFSATGNTKAVAEVIAAATDGELYEIVPEVPYTADDLNWNEPTSRSNKEHEDPSIRPAIAGGAKELDGYDTIFIGYPLWWGEAPNIVWNFVESNDLKGKTLIPFATSSSSGFGSSGVAEADVQSWVSGLNIQP